MAFKFVKYHLTLWSMAIYKKISHIHPWITWYIRAGHGILHLWSLNLIWYITHIWTPFKSYISIWGGVLRSCLYNTCTLPKHYLRLRHLSQNGPTNKDLNCYVLTQNFLIPISPPYIALCLQWTPFTQQACTLCCIGKQCQYSCSHCQGNNCEDDIAVSGTTGLSYTWDISGHRGARISQRSR